MMRNADDCLAAGGVMLVVVVAMLFGCLAAFAVMDAPAELDGSTAGANAATVEQIVAEGGRR